VYAAKPIDAGQEIFISYVDHMQKNKTVEQRRQHLFNHYVRRRGQDLSLPPPHAPHNIVLCSVAAIHLDTQHDTTHARPTGLLVRVSTLPSGARPGQAGEGRSLRGDDVVVITAINKLLTEI
jgi:hypothetical protein